MLTKCLITLLEYDSLEERYDERSPRGARRLSRRLRLHLQDEDIIAQGYQSRLFWLSQRLLFTQPLDSPAQSVILVGLLFHELRKMVRAQAALSARGILLRGVLTLGDVRVADTACFGPGLKIAERLLRDFGDLPRVFVDPRVLRALETEPLLRDGNLGADEEKQRIRPLLHLGQDGLWSVDHLRASEEEADPPSDENYRLFLLDHRRLLTDKLRERKRLDPLTRRLVWLASYHNRVVRRHRDRPGFNPNELRVRIPSHLRYRF